MKRFVVLPCLMAALAAMAWADHAPARPDMARRAEQLHRNLPVLRRLVGNALQLAGQSDALDRARSCNALAKDLAEVVRDAAKEKDTDRAQEFGTHLSKLLNEGVAGNLREAEKTLVAKTIRGEDIKQISDEASQFTQAAEEELMALPESDRAAVKDLITKSRKEVEVFKKPHAPPAVKPQ